MKTFLRILKWSFIAFIALIVLAVSAFFLFRPASPFKSALADSDRLELYLLQSQIPGGIAGEQTLDEATSFPIRAYGNTRTPILGHATLTGEEFKRIRKEFLSATTPGSMHAMCHLPIYGFRFYQGAKLVAETSICFHCSNFYAPQGDHYYWESLSPFAFGFQKHLNEILPSPKDKKI
jgi:hypothetical protein